MTERPAIEVVSWSPRDFATVSLDDPDLAACVLLAPGSWQLLKSPKQALDPSQLARAVALRITGLLDPSEVPSLTIVQAGVERNSASAVAHDSTVLLVLPEVQSVDLQQVAGVVAEAVVASRMRPAPPDQRCGEVVLALSEGLVRAGVLALAGLPPTLRPISDWLEPVEARRAIEVLAKEALDEERPWASRRALLAQASRAGTLKPDLAHAAAMLVETLGTPRRLLERPFDMLLAWQGSQSDTLPAPPAVLRKAISNALLAGMPKEDNPNDRDALVIAARERALLSGSLSRESVPGTAPADVFLRLAAQLRAGGSPGLCQWLSGVGIPSGIRTGCSEAGSPGVVFSRPHPGGGSEVVWRGPAHEENVLLVWPRWVLHPVLSHRGATLAFIDPTGAWQLTLDGAQPTLLTPGSFRQLAASPDGRTLALARRGSPATLIIQGQRVVRELAVGSAAGLAFVDADVVVAASGRSLSLAAVEGPIRPEVMELDCISALAARGGTLFAAAQPPCEAGLYKVDIFQASSVVVLKLREGPAGLAVLPDGAVAFATSEGLWRWREGSTPERFAVGLTPGDA